MGVTLSCDVVLKSSLGGECKRNIDMPSRALACQGRASMG